MNWQETKQLANKHQSKVNRARWLVKSKWCEPKQAAQLMGVTVKEIERVRK